jgi:PAS domain S-box-containing protein
MTSPKEHRSSYSWLPGLVAGIILVALLTGLVGLRLVEDRLVADAGQSLALAAADIAQKLDLLLFERYGDVQVLAGTVPRLGHDPRLWAAHAVFLKQAYPIYHWIGVIDSQGRVRASTDQTTVGLDVRQSEWVAAVSADSGVYVRDAGSDAISGGIESMVFATAVQAETGSSRSEEPRLVATYVAMSVLKDMVARTFQGKEGYWSTIEYQVVNGRGEVVIDSASVQKKDRVNLKTIKLPSALLLDSGRSSYIEEQHVRRQVPVVTGYAQMNGHEELASLRWGVLVRVDRGEVLAPIRAVIWKLAALGAVGSVPLFLALLWMARRVRNEWGHAQRTRATLEESRRFLQSTLDALTAHIAILDEQGTIVAVNGAWRQFGDGHELRDPDHALGRNYLEVCDSASGESSEQAKVMAEGIRSVMQGVCEVYTVEYPCHSQVEQRWFEARISRFENNGALRMVVAHYDITENERAFRTLCQATDTTRTIIAHALDAHILMDQDGMIVGWNPQAEQTFGWAQTDVLGRRLADVIVPPGDRDAHERGLWHFLESGAGPGLNTRIEVVGRHQEGREFPIELTITPLGQDGQYVFSAFARDITERKQHELHQTAEHAVTKMLLEATSLEQATCDILKAICRTLSWNVGVMWTMDTEMELMRCTEVWSSQDTDYTGFIDRTKQSTFALGIGLPGRTWQSRKVEWIADVARDGNFPRAPYAAAAGLHAAIAFPITSHDHVYGVMEFFTTALREPDEKLLQMLDSLAGQLSQFVNRTQAEQTLHVSQERFAGILDLAEDAIVSVDEAHRITLFNQGASKVFGYAPSEVLGQPVDMLLPSRFAQAHGRSMREFNASSIPKKMGTRREVVGLRKNGEEFPAEGTLAKVCINGETTSTVILRDISERTQAEQCLRQAKDQAEQAAREKGEILATVEAFFIAVNGEGIVTMWTSRAEDLFGLCLGEAMGRPFAKLPIRWDWQELLDAMGKAGDTLKSVRVDKIRLTPPEGTEVFLKLTVSPICEDRGMSYIFMGEDITERLNFERELVQAQKLESIGQLASGIAHEINTPIQFVGDNVRFLSDSFSDIGRVIGQYQRLLTAAKTGPCPPECIESCEAATIEADLAYLLAEIPKALAQSAEGINRVATIVRAMKEFAHPGNSEKAMTNLNHAIDSTVTVARNEWKYVADLHTALDPSLPPVPCLIGEFNQVVLNMIVNATHAIADAVKGTGKKGTITISTACQGDFVEVRIADTGMGIPESIRHKIFDPFFTTKAVGKGTGQGLAIAHSVVVDKHGGTITVDSEVGQGTTFVLRLPLVASSTGKRET